MVSKLHLFVAKIINNLITRNIFRVIFSVNSSLLIVIKKIDIELKNIGQRIKEIRGEKKLTQSSLASLCDIDVRTIQLIEKGSMNMSLKVFFALSEALDVSPEELFRFDKGRIS
jgi:putative transcriptional regulator